MNKQKQPDISIEEACSLILEKYPESLALTHYMDYYAYPEQFGSTAGPFKGKMAGQAFCTFTIEAWVFQNYAVLFCNGKVVKVVDDWNGINSVRV